VHRYSHSYYSHVIAIASAPLFKNSQAGPAVPTMLRLQQQQQVLDKADKLTKVLESLTDAAATAENSIAHFSFIMPDGKKFVVAVDPDEKVKNVRRNLQRQLAFPELAHRFLTYRGECMNEGMYVQHIERCLFL